MLSVALFPREGWWGNGLCDPENGLCDPAKNTHKGCVAVEFERCVTI